MLHVTPGKLDGQCKALAKYKPDLYSKILGPDGWWIAGVQ